ncbi:MAG: HAD family hydrolase [Marivibrio sp.]|uniref:HAD family hydrolase n=1 Tax=Marivibrio sp. TaxID=2039719 RepID=UPI0032EF6F1F
MSDAEAFRPLVPPVENPPAPAILLFDWDNTLVDTWPVIHASLADVFIHMGRKPWSLSEVRTRVRHSLRDSFPILFADRWEEARDVFYAAFERRHLEALTPAVGAADLLAAARDAGLTLGVVSNKTGGYLRTEAAHLGWDGYFKALVGAGDAARDKPDLAAVRHALDAMGVGADHDPARIWFVGDSNVDMEIAHAAGCLAVLIRPDHGPAGEFDAHPPALHLPDCAALQHLVTAL